MKIFRALGLLVFLLVIQYMLSDVFRAFSDAMVASFNMIEHAANASEMHINSIR